MNIRCIRLMLGSIALGGAVTLLRDAQAQTTSIDHDEFRPVESMEVFELSEMGLTLPLPKGWFVATNRVKMAPVLPLVDDAVEERALAVTTQHLYVTKRRAQKFDAFAAIKLSTFAEPPETLEKYPTVISYAHRALAIVEKSTTSKVRVLAAPRMLKVAEHEFASYELLIDYPRGTVYAKSYIAYLRGKVLGITLFANSRDQLREADAHVGGMSFHLPGE